MVPQYATSWAPPPPPRKSKLPLILGLLIPVLVLLLAIIVVVSVVVFRRPELSKEAAQRACRTAFEAGVAGAHALYHGDAKEMIIPSLQGIDLQETWRTDTGYNVNAIVRYTLSTMFVEPINDSLSLTCQATGRDEQVKTTVTKRD
jgi:hypothetical protein